MGRRLRRRPVRQINFVTNLNDLSEEKFHLWQCVEQHFDHRCLAVFLVGFRLLQHLLSLGLGLGLDGERFRLSSDFNLKNQTFSFQIFFKFLCIDLRLRSQLRLPR